MPAFDAERKKLTPEQYAVACNADTDSPSRTLLNNHAAGITSTSSAVSFSSLARRLTRLRLPSFTKPLLEKNVRRRPTVSSA